MAGNSYLASLSSPPLSSVLAADKEGAAPTQKNYSPFGSSSPKVAVVPPYLRSLRSAESPAKQNDSPFGSRKLSLPSSSSLVANAGNGAGAGAGAGGYLDSLSAKPVDVKPTTRTNSSPPPLPNSNTNTNTNTNYSPFGASGKKPTAQRRDTSYLGSLSQSNVVMPPAAAAAVAAAISGPNVTDVMAPTKPASPNSASAANVPPRGILGSCNSYLSSISKEATVKRSYSYRPLGAPRNFVVPAHGWGYLESLNQANPEARARGGPAASDATSERGTSTRANAILLTSGSIVDQDGRINESKANDDAGTAPTLAAFEKTSSQGNEFNSTVFPRRKAPHMSPNATGTPLPPGRTKVSIELDDESAALERLQSSLMNLPAAGSLGPAREPVIIGGASNLSGSSPVEVAGTSQWLTSVVAEPLVDDPKTIEFYPHPPDYPPPPMFGNYQYEAETDALPAVNIDSKEDTVPAKASSSKLFFVSEMDEIDSNGESGSGNSYELSGGSDDFNVGAIFESIRAALPSPPEVDLDDDSDEPELDTLGMTERIMRKTSAEGQAAGAGGASTWDAFLKAEENWAKLKAYKPNPTKDRPPMFVTTDGGTGNPQCWEKLRQQQGKQLDYDVVVCGGTLGIFFAAALQKKGHRVCVVEGGKLRGREQEWNISMKELLELKALGILTQDDIDAAIKTEFPACRSGFKNKEVTPLQGGYFDNGIGYECVTDDVLNLGVAPSILIERVRQRFEEWGGVVKEETRLQGVAISELLGSALDLGNNAEPITGRLVLDCMGNGSPISRQQRFGMKPDGICAVVGSCASGFDAQSNTLGDIIYTNTMIQDKGQHGKMQYFWEAFPVGIGRDGKEPGSSDTKTTYMFTYMDANEKRPTLETLMEDYWKLLPKYQKSITNPETDLDVKRVLFAYFPTYRESPLKPAWDRVLAVGDASGIQSPLSFGGFGALTRHLDRISGAVGEALDVDCLDKESLGEINAYTPNLSAAWMFQKAMSVRMGQKVDPRFMNRLLATNFEVMDKMGTKTIKPFLQDVIRFDGLIGSLVRSFQMDPTFMPEIVNHVGLLTLIDWLGHVSMMGMYGMLDTLVAPLMQAVVLKFIDDPKEQFLWRRRMEAWKFGSGNDYAFEAED